MIVSSKPNNSTKIAGAPVEPTSKKLELPSEQPLHPDTIIGQAVLVALDQKSTIKDITIDAPPGSGKTTILTGIVKHIVMESNAQIVVVTPTRSQALEITTRLMRLIPNRCIELSMSSKADSEPVASALRSKQEIEAKSTLAVGSNLGHVTISTISKWGMGFYRTPTFHFLIIDEAYQATYGDYVRLSRCAEKHIFMGDPGQIGPVVTAPVGLWAHTSSNPTRRLQDTIVKSNSNVQRFTVNDTWRLGPRTTEIVKRLYSFDFQSRRPETTVYIGDKPLHEIEVVDVRTPLSRPEPVSTDSITMLNMLARRALDMLENGYVERNGERTKLTNDDIAIVVGYNYQVEEAKLIFKRLNNGVCPFEVTTADRSQGKEWCVVLAADPASIPGGAAAHNFECGRLAVMLSRHSGHLTWFGSHPEDISATYDDTMIPELALEVRELMYGEAVIDEL